MVGGCVTEAAKQACGGDDVGRVGAGILAYVGRERGRRNWDCAWA